MLNEKPKQFNKALFVIEHNDELPLNALKKAIEYTEKNTIELDLVCVLPDLTILHYSNSIDILTRLKEASISSNRSRILETLKTLVPAFVGELKVAVGKQFIEVIQLVVQNHYDLLIKQTQNTSWFDSVLGSNDLHFLRKCPCALWLIHENAPQAYKNVGLAIDYSDNEIEIDLNQSLALQACSLSQAFDASLHIISAFDAGVASFASQWADNAEKFEQDFLREEQGRRNFESDYLIQDLRVKTKSDFQISKHILNGHPQAVIPKQCCHLNIDLLVMGTVGRSGLMGMLIGNTAESILLQIDCSLYTEKPKGFKCPISFSQESNRTRAR